MLHEGEAIWLSTLLGWVVGPPQGPKLFRAPRESTEGNQRHQTASRIEEFDILRSNRNEYGSTTRHVVCRSGMDEAPSQEKVVVKAGLVVRERHETTSSKIGELGEGTMVTVLEVIDSGEISRAHVLVKTGRLAGRHGFVTILFTNGEKGLSDPRPNNTGDAGSTSNRHSSRGSRGSIGSVLTSAAVTGTAQRRSPLRQAMERRPASGRTRSTPRKSARGAAAGGAAGAAAGGAAGASIRSAAPERAAASAARNWASFSEAAAISAQQTTPGASYNNPLASLVVPKLFFPMPKPMEQVIEQPAKPPKPQHAPPAATKPRSKSQHQHQQRASGSQPAAATAAGINPALAKNLRIQRAKLALEEAMRGHDAGLLEKAMYEGLDAGLDDGVLEAGMLALGELEGKPEEDRIADEAASPPTQTTGSGGELTADPSTQQQIRDGSLVKLHGLKAGVCLQGLGKCERAPTVGMPSHALEFTRNCKLTPDPDCTIQSSASYIHSMIRFPYLSQRAPASKSTTVGWGGWRKIRRHGLSRVQAAGRQLWATDP